MVAKKAQAKFVEDLKTLTQEQHLEILRLLKLHHVAYTENSNGIFFPMSAIKDDLFAELTQYVNFCSENRQQLEKRDKEMKAMHVDTDRAVQLPVPVVPPMAAAISVDTREADIARMKSELEKGNKKKTGTATTK